jgi:hypothetical protein
MKRVVPVFWIIMLLSSLESIYANVGVIESVDQFKQETKEGMVAVLWYCKDTVREGDKAWGKLHKNVQKAYEKVDKHTNYVRFFTADLAKPSLAPLQQEQGLSALPQGSAVSLYKDGGKQALLQNITAKHSDAIRDELSAFIRDNFGSAIRELEERHKRERERAEEDDDDDSGPRVSFGIYAGYPTRYYDPYYYYEPYSWGYYPYRYYPYRYYRERHRDRGGHSTHSSSGGHASRPSTGRTRRFISSYKGSGS